MMSLETPRPPIRALHEADAAGGKSRVGRAPWQRYVAEFIGTFAIVFAGCGAAIANAVVAGSVPPVGVALVFGLTVAVMIFALGPICAAHFNPAVTLGFATAGRFPWVHVPAYWAAQLLGATCASAVHRALYPADAVTAVAFGATLPGIGTGPSLLLEVLLTFFLMLVIAAVATDRRVHAVVPGLAIGGTVTLCAAMGGPLCGASMNPARSLGPALFAGGEALGVLWIYIAGPVVGAVVAARVFELLRDGPDHAQSAPADLSVRLAENGAERR